MIGSCWQNIICGKFFINLTHFVKQALLPKLFGLVCFQLQGVWLVIIITMCTEIPVHNANIQETLVRHIRSGSALFANYLFGGLQTEVG